MYWNRAPVVPTWSQVYGPSKPTPVPPSRKVLEALVIVQVSQPVLVWSYSGPIWASRQLEQFLKACNLPVLAGFVTHMGCIDPQIDRKVDLH